MIIKKNPIQPELIRIINSKKRKLEVYMLTVTENKVYCLYR